MVLAKGGEGFAQVIFWFDDQAPPRPDTSGRGQGQVLCEGEFLCGTEEVTDAGQDESPFHHRCPLRDQTEASCQYVGS
jgi:hypothetical protein